MRVNIFDNGLQSRTGHHFDFCLRLARSLHRRGWEVCVYGTTQSDPVIAALLQAAGCLFQPLFSHFAYASLDVGAEPMMEIEGAARVLATELERAAPADLNLFPSLKPLELYGFALSGLQGNTVGHAHAEPFHQGPFSASVWRRAARQLAQRGRKARLGAIDPVVAAFLASYLEGMKVETFPFAEGGDYVKQHYPEKPETIGFFGSQREERGMNLIAPLAEQLLELGHGVVLHDTNARFVNANGHPRLRIVPAFLDDLSKGMIDCDIVVCHMQRDQYVHRMSGIAVNAVAAGLPFVMPAGTLAAARFAGLGSNRCYLDHSMPDVLQAIQELAQNYPHHAAQARDAARRWRAENGAEHFIDKVLE